jgi:tetratricopeptide (TPR) repeat protein
VLLTLAGVLTHLPALQGERIWDDQYLSLGNPFIKSPLLILETFRHYLFLDSLSVHYRPIQNISYIFDYFFWNTDPVGFHLTNILLHTVCGILLFLLLRQLFGTLVVKPNANDLAAFLVALVWVVHPVHSAAVDYISGRADSLAFAFASAGWLAFLRARQAMHRFARCSIYFLAAFSGFLALCSREIACVWFILFIAHLLFIDRTATARLRLGALCCCVVLLVIYLGCRHLPESRPTPGAADNTDSIAFRGTLMARALGDYGRLLIFPANLHMERTIMNPIAYRSRHDWRDQMGDEYLSILGLIILATLVYGSIRPGHGQRLRFFGGFWCIAGFLPISNIVPLNATVAEHWLYLPSVGFFIFATGCTLELSRPFKQLSVFCVLLAALALGVRSYVRSTDWVTAETFYRRTIASGGGSPRSGLNLGQICVDRGDYAEAEKIFRRVLAIAPDYPLAQSNLASALWHQGKSPEAEALFGRLDKSSAAMAKEYPRTWIGSLNLARLRRLAGDNRSALDVLERARKTYPEVWELISLESEILRQTRGPDPALHLIEDFAGKNWWHYQAALALGRLYAQKGDIDLAVRALQRASRLDVHDTESLDLIANIRFRQKKFDEALSSQKRAVARQPDEPHQYTLLSDILTKIGRSSEAHIALAKASELRAITQNR